MLIFSERFKLKIIEKISYKKLISLITEIKV